MLLNLGDEWEANDELPPKLMALSEKIGMRRTEEKMKTWIHNVRVHSQEMDRAAREVEVAYAARRAVLRRREQE